MLKWVVIYAGVIAGGALGLQALEYRRLVRADAGAWPQLLVAVAFLALGLFAGARLFGRHPAPDPGNPPAQAALGISARELDVLREIAAGRSNKEIAGRLAIAPNTVKTHLAHLYDKLGARRRTEAIARARELGCCPSFSYQCAEITLSGDCRRPGCLSWSWVFIAAKGASMLRNILVFGVIAGILVAVPTYFIGVATSDGPPPAYGMLVGYTAMLVALSLVFVGIKRQRDLAGGGVIGFWPALGMGLAISAVASILYALSWEAVLAATGVDFGAQYAEALVAAEKAKGVSGAELARYVAEMETFKTNYADPLYRLPTTLTEIFPVGVLVSLVSAGLLRNPRFMAARRE
ncbi:DUF4199 family protein [Sandarakinorhabdus sp. DWP1-3-1]|uniref:DUF4199 family protein n=1 Tax=Sandarakinorhabdus sp. DWP1-3-1 TaxID=2804627 RepID=UPI003CFB4F74